MTKRKILVLSSVFPPLESTACNRIWSWAEHFSEAGLHPIFVTRHWKAEDNLDDYPDDLRPVSRRDEQGYSVVAVPVRRRMLYRILTSNRYTSKLAVLLGIVSGGTGSFSIRSHFLVDVKHQVHQIIKNEEIHAILVSAPDGNLIRVASRAHRVFGVPFVVDFRDAWRSDFTAFRRKASLLKVVQNKIQKHRIRTWVKSASAITSISPTLQNSMKRHLDSDDKVLHDVVFNGFEERLLEIRQTKQPCQFSLTFYGTLYGGQFGDYQSMELIFAGIRKFKSLSQNLHRTLSLNLLGIYRNPDVVALAQKYLPADMINVIDRLPRIELLQQAATSSVFLLPSFSGCAGVVGTRIFEYLALRNPVILAPTDGDILAKLIQETNGGTIANSVDEVVQALECYYNNWELGIDANANLDVDALRFYTRKQQALKMAEIISKVAHPARSLPAVSLQ